MFLHFGNHFKQLFGPLKGSEKKKDEQALRQEFMIEFTVICTKKQNSNPMYLKDTLVSVAERLVSTSTVHRRHYKGCFYTMRWDICVPHIARHRNERLSWARPHVHLTVDQWKRFLFTDELFFSLQSDSSNCLTWRDQGKRYHLANIHKKDLYEGGSVCVSDGITLGRHTDLYFFHVELQMLTSIKIMFFLLICSRLRSFCLRSYTSAIGNNFLLQGNNGQLDNRITDYVYEGIEQHPSSHFRAYFTATTGRLVSTSTVRRRHHEGGV